MCVDPMAAEGKRKRVDRPSWSKLAKRRFVYVSLVKAAVRRYTEKKGKSHFGMSRTCGRQPGLSHSTAWGTDHLPSGAMAPSNTTQYLMELAYSDLLNTTAQQCDLSSRPSTLPQTQDEHLYSSLYSDDETMAFQQRDFEDVYFLNEL